MSPGLPTVYLDATIPSFYYEDRPAIILQAWREIPVQFRDSAPGRYELLTSDETIRELQDPGYPEDKRARCLALVAGVPRLAVNAEILDLAGYYIQERIMPSGDPGEALHLAFASWYRIQYLLTWNYRHLANANKFRRIEVLNRRRGPASPLLVSPAQLLGINYARDTDPR